MLNRELHAFYARWRAKADQYQDGNIRDALDRFFTLFVIYNRLYAEVTFHLAREGPLNLATRTSFPDKQAATEYVRQYLGSANMIQLFETDPACAEAIQAIIALLDGPLHGRQFSIRLDMIYGLPQRDKDLELLRKFRSAKPDERGRAVLEFLYAVRCNLFHGHKGFDPVQIEVMRPANALLLHIIKILFERLNR